MSTISVDRKAVKLTLRIYRARIMYRCLNRQRQNQMNLEDKKRRALSRLLKDKRQELGWSQREFARRIGVTHATLNSWESAKTTADTKNIEKIANVLTMPSWEVMKALNENMEPDVDIQEVLDLIDRLPMSDIFKINMAIAGKLSQAA
jgi:transcriptional regulator with XRE-family HTH domain